MTKDTKHVIIALTGIFAFCTLVVFGYVSLANSFREQRNCEWANIDNIELHAHINIPKVESADCDCSYDEMTNTKKSIFTVKKYALNLDKYIKRNKLKKLNNLSEIDFNRFLNLEKDFLADANLYYRLNSSNEEHSDILFDKTSGKLWVTINYQD